MSAVAVGKPRYREVDGLRALAALGVVLVHVSDYFPVPHNQLAQYLIESNPGTPRTAGVMFFAISGFVLYRPFVLAHLKGNRMPELVPFALRRAARIAPAYWIALAIVVVWFSYGYIETPSGIVRYFGFGQIYGNLETLGGGLSVAWTLCVEVTYYLALPLIALGARAIARRCRPFYAELLTCLLLLGISCLWEALVLDNVNYDTGWVIPMLSWLPGCIGMIAAGMTLAVLSAHCQLRTVPSRIYAQVSARPWICWVLGLVILYFEAKVSVTLGPANWWVLNNLMKLVACGLLIAPFVIGDSDRGILRLIFRNRVIVFIGTVSYGIYLWHDPILMKLQTHIHSTGLVGETAIVFAISIAVGAASYYLIELPAQKLAKRYIAHRRARKAPPVRAAVEVAS